MLHLVHTWYTWYDLFNYVLARNQLALVHNLCLILQVTFVYGLSIQQHTTAISIYKSPFYKGFEWFCYTIYIIVGIDMQLYF